MLTRGARFILAGLLLAGFFVPAFSAQASATCAAGVSESGGTHKRCSSPTDGVFHVWTPGAFDAAKPGYTVVFVHGFSDQCGRPSRLDASDGVSDTWFNTDPTYIDAYWKAQNLSSVFAASATGGTGNSIFIAPQAPTCSTARPHTDAAEHWSDFNSLLTDITAAGISRPNGPVILVGHSGAFVMLNKWEGNGAVKHVIHLDTLYVTAGFAAWLKDPSHTGTVVVTDDEYLPNPANGGKPDEGQVDGVVNQIADKVTLTSMPAGVSGMSPAAQQARVLYVKTSSLTHMQLISGGVIPTMVQRAPSAGTGTSGTPAPPPSGGGSGSSGGGTSGSPSTTTQAPISFQTPRLEIPIPNVHFTSGLTGDSVITLPWIAQYVSGVYTFLIGIVGLVAAVMMIIGGFTYLTSGGDKSKIAGGKKRIIDALIGLTLAFGSYVILYTINPNLVQFASLQLLGISTVTYGELVDGPTGLPTPDSPSGPAPDPVAPPSGSNARTCKGTADCLPWCRKAGCTKVYCPEGDASKCITNLAGFEGVTLHAMDPKESPWASDCDSSKFPNIPPGSPPLAIPSLTYIDARRQTAAQLVIDGLTRANQYIGEHHASENIKIYLKNCYRDTREDFRSQCAIIMRPPPHNDPSDKWGKSTWPGPNPHSSGYGCDLWLMMGKEELKSGKFASDGPGGAYKAGDSKYNYAKKTLVEILTNPAVGGRRLDYEDWHFNFGGFNPSYCIGSACP